MTSNTQNQNNQEGLTNEELASLELKWSRRSSIIMFVTCLLLSVFSVFGFLIYKEFHKPGLQDQQAPNKTVAGEKTYSNDYWGIKFNYPPSWYPVIGSFDEGDYFFASQPVNFISEVEDDGALLELQTYNNLKRTSFSDWLTDREQNYFPRGNLSSRQISTLNNFQMAQYTLIPNKPINNMNYVDMRLLTKDSFKIYQIMLETKTKEAHDKHLQEFEQILQNTQQYQGFGS